MASAGYEWAQQNLPGGIDAYYSNINNYLAAGHTQEEIAQAMQDYGISAQDVMTAKAIASASAPTFVDTTGPAAPAPASAPTAAPTPAPAPAPEPAVETIQMSPAPGSTKSLSYTEADVRPSTTQRPEVVQQYLLDRYGVSSLSDIGVGTGSEGEKTLVNLKTGKELQIQPKYYNTENISGYNIGITPSGKPGVVIESENSGGFFSDLFQGVKELVASPAGQMILSAVIPGLGAEVAAALNVSQAVGTAIASTAAQIASGVDPEKALQNAVTNAVVSTGSAAVAKEINSALTGMDTATANAISNAAGSALSSAATTAARGGSSSDIMNSAVAGVAGSVTSSLTGEKALGAAITGGLTGGTLGAISGAATAAARPSEEQTFKQVSAYENLQDAISSANLTPEEAEAVRQATQSVYAAASTAQALPATVSDVAPSAPTRIGAPFAANDPRFLSAMEKNPGLFKAFSEYTNTYGFSAGNTVYQGLLEQELAKTPTDQTLREEYKRITGNEYQASAEAAPQATDLGTLTITASKLPYEPEIIAPPAYVVASINNTGTKALVYNNVGVPSVVDIQPGVQVQPGQNVAIDPATNAIVTPAVEPEAVPETKPAIAPEVAPSVVPEAVPSPVTTPVTEVVPEAAPQPRPVSPTTPIETTPPGPTIPTVPSYPFVAPSFTADSGVTDTVRDTYTTTPTTEPTATTPTATPYVSETGTVSATPTPVETKPEEKTKTKEDTYRPSLTTASVSPTRTSALSKVLQSNYYPVSTTGLTAYRPAGEIESEESGKQRQDVWNEASLRLKDALGL